MLIAGILRQRGLGYVVVEMDRRRVDSLRADGEPVVYGNAAAPPVMEQTHPESARTLVVAIPDPVVPRQIVSSIKHHHPGLDIVARARGRDEAAVLTALGASEAVIAERELGLEMARHTLHRAGVSMMEAQAVLQRLRWGAEPERQAASIPRAPAQRPAAEPTPPVERPTPRTARVVRRRPSSEDSGAESS
jgi:CPA2 family monovalent cation:H+ antiporter-2